MSSTNKTSQMKLNQWAASDRPQRTDFNYDNALIEEAYVKHTGDKVSHVTDSEREAWNNCVHYGTYYGNGSPSRSVTTGCSFEPKFVIVFASSRPLSYSDFTEGKKYNYVGFASQISATINLAVEDYGATLVVKQDTAASYKDEYTCLNQSGVAYTYIMFR